MSSLPIVGILALQGCVEPHTEHIKNIGAKPLYVRSEDELLESDCLIIPGGESSTMLNLLKRNELFAALKKYVIEKPTWGICAGSILLAKEVAAPAQDSLSALPIKATRNYYGSQLDSFKAEIDLSEISPKGALAVDFIRAPLLEPLNFEVQTLARYEGQGVLFRYKHILCSSFHAELGHDSRLHEFFLGMCEL